MRRCNLAIAAVVVVALLVAVTPVEGLEGGWVLRAPLPVLVKNAAAVGLNGQIYAMGYNYSTFNYAYNPSLDTWASKTPMPNNQSQFAMASYENKIYVVGGWVSYESPSLATGYVTGAVQIYDAANDSWNAGALMPTPRANLQAAVVDGKVYLIGGSLQDNADTNANEAYAVADDSWAILSPIPHAVSNYGIAVVGGKIYVIGGGNGGKYGNAVSYVQIYDPKTDTWTQGAPAPAPLGDATATAINKAGSWKIYAIGIPNQYFDTNSTATMQTYDTQTSSWAEGSSVPAPGYVGFSAITLNGTLYAVGGKPFAWFTPGLFKTVNEQYYLSNSETTPSTTSTLTPAPTQSPTLAPTQTPTAIPTMPVPSPTPTFNPNPSPTATVPEFPIWIVLPLAIITELMAAIAVKRKKPKQSS